MSRLMSVSLTEQAVRDRTKTVTRRLGWRFAKPGQHITLCRKVMGRRRTGGTVEPLVRIAEVEVVSVRRERLNTITEDDVRLEGFGDWVDQFGGYATARFIGFFCGEMGCDWDAEVTRIEWRYLDPAPAGAPVVSRACVRCGSTEGRVVLAASSKSGFKHDVCANTNGCHARRKQRRLIAEAERRGYDRAVEALRDPETWARYCATRLLADGEQRISIWQPREAADYLGAIVDDLFAPTTPTETAARPGGGTHAEADPDVDTVNTEAGAREPSANQGADHR